MDAPKSKFKLVISESLSKWFKNIYIIDMIFSQISIIHYTRTIFTNYKTVLNTFILDCYNNFKIIVVLE